MKIKLKKISIIVYARGDFEQTKKTLYSIIDQNVNHLFFDVLILSDDSNPNFLEKLNKFIDSELLINYSILPLDKYNGLPLSLVFLLKNNLVNGKYTTILKSGDVLKEGWIQYFLDNLFDLNKDCYMSDLKEKLLVEKKVSKKDRNKDWLKPEYKVVKSKIFISESSSKELTLDEALSTKAIFLGKFFKTSRIKDIEAVDDRILYQHIFVYFEMILKCSSFYYVSKISATIVHKPLFPHKKMDSERIKLLLNVLNAMVCPKPYVNGQVLQLLALAIINTSKDLRYVYKLKNYKYLDNKNYVIVPTYMSKWKTILLTKNIIETGKLQKKRK